MHRRSVSIDQSAEKYTERASGSRRHPSATNHKDVRDESTFVDVVIPSNLLAQSHLDPYVLGAKQDLDPRNEGSDVSFDARRIAAHQNEKVKRAFERSASVPIGAANHNMAMGGSIRTNDFVLEGSIVTPRRTSLTAKQEVGHAHTQAYDRLTYSDLTVARETHLTRPDAIHPRQTDYFGDFNFNSPLHRPDQPSDTELTVDPMTITHGHGFSAHGLDLEGAKQRGSDASQYRASIDRNGIKRSGRSTNSNVRKGSILERASVTVSGAVRTVESAVRRSSLQDTYKKAKVRGIQLQRNKWAMLTFEYSFYTILVAFVYFVLVGVPLWKGTVYWLWWVFGHRFVVPGTWAVTIGVAALYAYTPLLILFEGDPPIPEMSSRSMTETAGTHDTALMIPCYKSAQIIGPTLEAALKIFPPSHIFVISNGNSPTPLDNTEEVCKRYGVNFVWSPIGSKIVAQFVGCYAAKGFKNVLLIDDDCALPPNFPIVSTRLTNHVKCIGYTIKSVGPNSSRGTLCQQAQDLEYKISGLQRALAGMIGSATFPHGAISLWDLEFLIQTFREHPGFSVSEDWFFGHVARQQGSRIQMCTSVFIETETPSAVFFSSGGARGGFGEMTIFKQRFLRWNFFFVNGMWYNMAYIFCSWELGFWEIGAKLFVFQEIYETLLYLLTPFVLPISFMIRPSFSGYLFMGTFCLYFLNVVIFNELHLRLKNERVKSRCVYLYYMPYKMILTLINVGSCYWSLYKYAAYFATRHPKIVEDEHAVDVVLRMEESNTAKSAAAGGDGRRMTVTAIGSQLHGTVIDDTSLDGIDRERKMTITTFEPALGLETHPLSPVAEQSATSPMANRLDSSSIIISARNFSFTSSTRSTRRGPETNNVSAAALAAHQSSLSSSPGHYVYRQDEHSLQSKDSLSHHERENHIVQQPSPGPLPKRQVSRHSSHRSSCSQTASPRSVSLRSRGAVERVRADFESPTFGDLMDRLAAVEQRLNATRISALDVNIGVAEGGVNVIETLPESTGDNEDSATGREDWKIDKEAGESWNMV